MQANADLNLECPHCGGYVVVKLAELNCRIFRHGVLKSTGQQIDPHASQVMCEDLIAGDLIYGCGKPFRVVGATTEICDYI